MSTRLKVEQALQPYGLKQSGRELRFNSPFRPGADGMTCTITFADDEHGTWYDHKDGVGGSLYDFAQRLGIALPQREAVEVSKRRYDSLRQYAGVKGVPEQIFIDAGWKEITYFDGRPCFVFPTRGGLRYRFIDGEKPSFKSCDGFKPCWYGLDKAVATAGARPLILCNGEPSTIVAQHFGLPAFCMPGGENHKVSAELMAELKSKWQGEIVIALDCDPTGRRGVQRFTDAFTGMRYTVVDLMLEDKGDLADFCKLHEKSLAADFAALPKLNAPVEKAADVTTLAALTKDLLALRKAEDKPDGLPLVLEKLQGEIDRLRSDSSVQITQSWEQVADEYQAWVAANLRNKGKLPGFDTGLEKLNEITCGLEKGRVFVVLAETGIGKSTLIASIASKLSPQAPGLLIPTETRNINLFNKIVAYRTHIPTHYMRQGHLEPNQAGLVYSTIALLKQQRCQVIECQNPTTAQILTTARRSVLETGCEWVIIDSLSNVTVPLSNGLFDTISAAADCAQALARMGLMVLVTSQVGRNLKGRASLVPTLHDGKGSGRIEENADCVLALYNHDILVKRGEAEPNDAFPPGTTAVRNLKDREYGENEGKMIQLKWKGGLGIFND
jgi:replicative DNA helicase